MGKLLVYFFIFSFFAFVAFSPQSADDLYTEINTEVKKTEKRIRDKIQSEKDWKKRQRMQSVLGKICIKKRADDCVEVLQLAALRDLMIEVGESDQAFIQVEFQKVKKRR